MASIAVEKGCSTKTSHMLWIANVTFKSEFLEDQGAMRDNDKMCRIQCIAKTQVPACEHQFHLLWPKPCPKCPPQNYIVPSLGDFETSWKISKQKDIHATKPLG